MAVSTALLCARVCVCGKHKYRIKRITDDNSRIISCSEYGLATHTAERCSHNVIYAQTRTRTTNDLPGSFDLNICDIGMAAGMTAGMLATLAEHNLVDRKRIGMRSHAM